MSGLIHTYWIKGFITLSHSFKCAVPIAGSSPIRPAGKILRPMLIRPFKKVPVVITTQSDLMRVPSSAIYL